MKFKSNPKKTSNKYESHVIITEIITKDDVDGYCMTEGDEVNHIIYIDGNNSFERAKTLSDLINNGCGKPRG